jgi:hypothetical protein
MSRDMPCCPTWQETMLGLAPAAIVSATNAEPALEGARGGRGVDTVMFGGIDSGSGGIIQVGLLQRDRR